MIPSISKGGINRQKPFKLAISLHLCESNLDTLIKISIAKINYESLLN